MAFNGSHGIFLSLALLLAIMAATPYVGKGEISVTPAALFVTGKLYCTPTGNPSPIGNSPPLVNATVIITCPNITRVPVRTDVNGFFNGTIVTPLGVKLNINLSITSIISVCQVSVPLPVRSCPVLPVRGVLRGVLTPVGFLLVNVLSGVLGILGGLVNGVGGLVITAVADTFGFV
ncbi:uncharacterized protein LOC113782084 [Coffea eugenioides]|uniref:uncharacterized protein LOC113782084 n=1 Tax=Coffea eugenioides TaxID=49369 RepID=UPI000F6077DA|nr:uncharacterized protein LOC113782084 [Coffea eugenioides]